MGSAKPFVSVFTLKQKHFLSVQQFYLLYSVRKEGVGVPGAAFPGKQHNKRFKFLLTEQYAAIKS